MLTGCIVLSGLLVLLLGTPGCGGDDDDDGPTASEITAKGWELYEARDYAGALEKFNEAVSEDPDYTDGYVGLGWSYGKLAQKIESISNFQIALSKDAQNVDALAGIALAYLANDEYDQAIASANQALAINPAYSFAHGSNVTWRNLRIVLAESHYYKGEFPEARDEVDKLSPGWTDEFDPDDPDHLKMLLEEIEKASIG
jgi:tetratricopeptide (TPR) repeat protein